MKILLIQPNFLVKTLHPPLGLAYIAGALKDKFAVQMLDCTFLNGYNELENKLKNINADVVGMSCLTTMFDDALKIASVVKNIMKSVVIFGGPHPTLFPRECVENKDVDIVVRGEGEMVTGQILQAIERKQSLENIPGIVYKENGQIIETKPREPIEDLDSLPLPAYELLPPQYLDGRRATMSLISSRGCPFRCNFCQPVQRLLFGTRIKYESINRIIEQIQYLHSHFNIRYIMFADDTFNLDESRIINLCQQIIDRGLNRLHYRCNIRANIIPKPQTVELMRKAGFRCVSFGAESGSQVILDELCKGTNVAQNIEIAHIFKRFDFEIYLYLMLGAPSENKQTLRETVEMVQRIKPDYARVSITSPLPGTDLEKLCRNKGILKTELSPRDLAYYESFSQLPIGLKVSLRELLKTKKKIEAISRYTRISKKFKNNPFYIFYLLKRLFEKMTQK